MSWLFTLIRQVITPVACLACFALTAQGNIVARAQNLESALMPGKVIEGHAKYEAECKNCHIRFNRPAQTGLCLDCHKSVAADVNGKRGYHGRIKAQECRSCHTEHKGRDAKIVPLDERKFDHTLTDFALRGKHGAVQCAKCHRPSIKHRDAPSDCQSCHRKDDKHKGGLGNRCENCHSESGWKESRFDHAKTNFALRYKHEQAKCAQCHANENYAKTPKECVACHRKDDAQKGHNGHNGARCESCHNEADWKIATFNHGRDTRFALRGRHGNVKCMSCHRSPIYAAKLSSTCHACHSGADPHKGSLGTKCESCHNERGWKSSSFDHDLNTRFALRNKHREAKCQSCHKDAEFREKLPTNCVGCHRREDAHKGSLGEKCESCHSDRSWKQARFDHSRDTRFALKGRHQEAKCQSCHKEPGYGVKLPMTCTGCHEKDDKHKGQLGAKCEECHNERDWRTTAFDHQRSAFPLHGKHANVECKKCHLSEAFKDAQTACISCHAKDDAHKERLGPQCEQCHSAQSWREWDFDHNRRSSFKLEGKHTKVSCLSCHKQPVKQPVKGKLELAADCMSCHRNEDIHSGTYGQQCAKCHTPDNWRRIINPEFSLPGRPARPAPGSRIR